MEQNHNKTKEKPVLHHELPNINACCHTIVGVKRFEYLHWHDNIELASPLDKPCRFLIDGVLYDAVPGDLIVTAPCVTHQFQSLNGNTKYRVCQISRSFLQSFGISPGGVKALIKKEELEQNPVLYTKINALFEWLESEKSSTTDNPNPVLQSLAVSLYLLLARSFPESDTVRSDESELKMFHTIFRYVNDHYLENITVGSISKSLYCTRGRLAAIFLQYAGMRLTEYLRELRIDHARQLLASGSSITKAALESGFQNIRTFNNSFRDLTGMTPSEYVKQLKQGASE